MSPVVRLDATFLAQGLLITRAKTLKQADFSWNAVGARGSLDIAEGLKLAALVRLNLAWNGLGPERAPRTTLPVGTGSIHGGFS